ncbi:MAG: hypothetical protein IJ568_04805 [Bacilli bacterium]|nr:hypothetical protein [Bacilli bacterium]
MPNISSHMAVAKKVSELLKINSEDFYKGNLIPDLYRNKFKSHFKTAGERYLIPDIVVVKNNLNLNNMKDLGKFVHLMLDYYYLEDYLDEINDNVFINDNIYNDYDIINDLIIKKFNINISYLENILLSIDDDIDRDLLFYNLECLKKNKNGVLKYLEEKKFLSFLENVSYKICDDIKNNI